MATYRPRTALAVLLATASAAATATACAPAGEDAADAESDLTALTSLWADAKRLDLGDLSRMASGFGTDALNGALANDGTGLGARFEPPAVFGVTAEPNRLLPDHAEIRGLDAVVSGLAARFGERELGTQVNATRLDHLRATADDYFVESAFTLRAGAVPDWSFQAGGFDVRLGFDAEAALSSRVIVATASDRLPSLVSAPLAALQQMRGFVVPRSIGDIAAMKPGEMFALRGTGKLGANLGVGAPLLIAEPTGALGYRVVVSAGVATVVSGQLDVQLQRLAGDEVVVDLGVENGRGISFRAGIGDQWGVKGICDDGRSCLRPVELGGQRIDLARLVEAAIESRMNRYLSSHVSASSDLSGGRVSLSRFRFHLERGNADEVSRALEHLLKFDLRLAQALANRDAGETDAAVRQDFDAVRAATTSTRNFGVQLLGMNIYHRAVVRREGTFILQTPEGGRAYLFDHVQKEGGWFRERNAYARTGIGAQVVDASDPTGFRPSANLLMETLSSHGNMSDDFMLDNLDALIVGLAGRRALNALDRFGSALEKSVEASCPEPAPGSSERWSERCNVALLDDGRIQDLIRRGIAEVEPALEGLPPSTQDLVRKAASTRIRLQAVSINALDGTGGAGAAIRVGIRLDDRALDLLTSQSRDAYRNAVREYYGALWAKRIDLAEPHVRTAYVDAADRSWGAFYTSMANRFAARAASYQRVLAAERALPRVLAGRTFVSHPLGIRFTVQAQDRARLESIALTSTSHERAVLAARLFDELLEEARAFRAPLDPAHAAMFPLLGLVPAANVEVRMGIGADTESSFFKRRERFAKVGFQSTSAIGRGHEVALLGAGMFDLGAVVTDGL